MYVCTYVCMYVCIQAGGLEAQEVLVDARDLSSAAHTPGARVSEVRLCTHMGVGALFALMYHRCVAVRVLAA